MFFVGRLILRELQFIYNNKLYMFLVVKAFATAKHSLILQYSSSKKANFNFWHVHTLRSVFVNSPPPTPEVILTNFFAEPTVLLVPITSREYIKFLLLLQRRICRSKPCLLSVESREVTIIVNTWGLRGNFLVISSRAVDLTRRPYD